MEDDVLDAICGGSGGVWMTDPLQKFPALKGALHAHTTCSEGDLTPLELLEIYRNLGFDFVALTDHDFLMSPHAYQRVPDVFENLLVFKGVERTIFARGYFHVSEIRGDIETLHIFDHPADYNLSVDRVIERIQDIQAIMPLDAIEVTSKGFYTPEYDIDRIPYPKVISREARSVVAETGGIADQEPPGIFE